MMVTPCAAAADDLSHVRISIAEITGYGLAKLDENALGKPRFRQPYVFISGYFQLYNRRANDVEIK
jgi:hypothetical protein